ncbi:MAG: outer membrane lipid asymmetry maintenance protein MlaD [Pseudomonadota bacterium]
MSRSVIETLLGAIVLLVACGFVVYAYGTSDAGDPGGYTLNARFDRIDGINVGSDVRISGIKVGEVVGQSLDPTTFRAELVLSVRPDLSLPADSSAAIVSESLLGGRYVALAPGGDDVALQPGDQISFTQSSINLEDLVGRFVFSGSEGG